MGACKRNRPRLRLTAPRRRALEILERRVEGLTPAFFAAEMWPDSKCWKRSYKCGPKGASRGIAMATAAGGFLGKLGRLGLVQTKLVFGHHQMHVITSEGRKALEHDRGQENTSC